MNEQPNVWTAEGVEGSVWVDATDPHGRGGYEWAAPDEATAATLVDQLRLGALVLTAPEGVGVRADGTMIAPGSVAADLDDEWSRRYAECPGAGILIGAPERTRCYEVRRRPVPAPETMPARDVIRLLLDDGHGIERLADVDGERFAQVSGGEDFAIRWLASTGLDALVTVERGTR